MSRCARILVIAVAWTAAAALGALIVSGKLASAAVHEAYGAACALVGYMTADLLGRRRD